MTDEKPDEKSLGQIDYEAEVAERPLYHDGTPRKTWKELGEVERTSWERGPHPTPPGR